MVMAASVGTMAIPRADPFAGLVLSHFASVNPLSYQEPMEEGKSILPI